jgi:glucose/arabinose dehydrogenase
MSRTSAVAIAILLSASALTAGGQSPGPSAAPANAPFTVEVVADFDSPWAMTFLPDGRLLVTEKAGTLYLVSADGRQRKSVAGMPKVSSEGQGALGDVVLHPRFAQNKLVYFSYSEAGADGKGVVLARGTLVDGDAPALQKVETLFRATPYVDGNGHFAGRIAFGPDGHLFFTNGERQKFDPAHHYDDKPIPDHDTRPEFEKYKVNWTPVISPAGLIVYSGKLWPQWKGDLFIGGLSSQALVRVDVDGTNARKGDQWPMGARIREPEEGPDGAIWLLEDGGRGSQGRLLKLTPKK